jgi:hypothetical protein
MNRNKCILCFLVLTLAVLAACSSQPTANQSKKAWAPPDKIQGKIQVLLESTGASDAALNAGGSSVYLWEGTRRYRLFLRTPVDVVHGNQYVVEGVYAQKAIDDLGDPDNGKNGYPLPASCSHVVRMAWSGLSFDAIDADASLVCARIKRYPARPLFLVSRIRPATAEDNAGGAAEAKNDTEAEEKDVKEVTVPADKQRASLIEGPAVQPAPLWEPEGGTVHCKVDIDTKGKVYELETGAQLCEAVPWSQFRYQPPVQGGHPVKVRTEVEVRFEARK